MNNDLISIKVYDMLNPYIEKIEKKFRVKVLIIVLERIRNFLIVEGFFKRKELGSKLFTENGQLTVSSDNELSTSISFSDKYNDTSVSTQPSLSWVEKNNCDLSSDIEDLSEELVRVIKRILNSNSSSQIEMKKLYDEIEECFYISYK